MRTHALLPSVVLSLAAAAGPAAAQPAVPAPQAPASGASVQVPLTISWSAVLDPGAINGGYNWQVSRSASFSPLVLADSTSPATTSDVVSGLVNGTYWWRVRGVNSAGVNGPFSGSRQFTVPAAPPGPSEGALPAPSLVAPAVDAPFRPGQAIPFDWSDVAGAATYTIQIDDSQTFSAPFVLDQTVSASSLGTSTLPTRRMWWRVRANGPSGSPGAWSGARRFEVKN